MRLSPCFVIGLTSVDPHVNVLRKWEGLHEHKGEGAGGT